MTAEERRAYADAHRNRRSIQSTNAVKTQRSVLYWKMIAAMLLFVAFLSLDYTGCKVYGIGSAEIVSKVTADYNIPIDYFRNL